MRVTLFFVVLLPGLCGQIAVPIQEDLKQRIDRIDPGRIRSIVEKLASFGTRHTLSDTESPTRGIGAARAWIKTAFEEISESTGGRLKVTMDAHSIPKGARLPNGVELVNVVATLPGKDPDRYVIVSGHYDSMPGSVMDGESDAPGANDDASGTAVVIEAARVLADLEPRATILFMAVAGEEQGLVGADAHARRAREANHRIEAMITNDIVGGVTGSSGKRENHRVRLFSEGVPSGPVNAQDRPRSTQEGSDNDAPSRQLARYLKQRGEAYVAGFEVTLIFRQDRYLRGGDHKAFNRYGFPGVRFTEVHENYDWQHQNVRRDGDRVFGDLPSNLDYDFIARVCRVNTISIAELALAPGSPRQVRVMIDELTPHTTLRWEANPEEDLGGYRVYYRRTHEPFWTHRRDVAKDQTSVTLEGLSKDDWLFGVASVDKASRESLPIYPRPARSRRPR